MPPTLSEHNNSLFSYLHVSLLHLFLKHKYVSNVNETFTYPYPWDDQPLDDLILLHLG